MRLPYGVARSPWTSSTLDGDYIKAEAQAGRMGQILYAVATKVPGGFEFRAPIVEDKEANKRAEKAIAEKKPEWIVNNIIPTEPFPKGNDNRPLMYGMLTWSDFFSPRQLLSMGVIVETLYEVNVIINSQYDKGKADAIATYLGLALSKCPNYSSYLSSWHAPRTVMRSVFDRHDFSFKWTFGEFDGAANLMPWAIDQVYDAYKNMASLAAPVQISFITKNIGDPDQFVKITRDSASNLVLYQIDCDG
jgi:adenine-specific DNA methylase